MRSPGELRHKVRKCPERFVPFAKSFHPGFATDAGTNKDGRRKSSNRQKGGRGRTLGRGALSRLRGTCAPRAVPQTN